MDIIADVPDNTIKCTRKFWVFNIGITKGCKLWGIQRDTSCRCGILPKIHGKVSFIHPIY